MPAALKPSTGTTTAAPTIGSMSSSAPASVGNPTPGSPASGPVKQLPAAPAAIPAAPPAAPTKPTLGLAPRPVHRPTPKPATYGQAGSWSEPDPKTPAPMTVQPEPVPGAANQLDFGPITWSPEQIKAWGPATGPGGQTPTVPKYTVEQQRAFMSAAAGPEAPVGVPMTGKNTHNWEQAKGGLRPLLAKPEATKSTSLNPFDVWNRTQDWKWGEGMPGHSPDLYRDAHKLPAYQFDAGHLTPEEAPHADTISAAWAANPGAAAEAASLPPARIPGMAEYAKQRNVGVYNPHFEQWWASQGPVGRQGDVDNGNPYARVRRYAETQQGEMLAHAKHKSSRDAEVAAQHRKEQLAEGTGFWENYTNSTPAQVRGDPIQGDYYKAKYEQQGYKPEEAANRATHAAAADQHLNQNHSGEAQSDSYVQQLWQRSKPVQALTNAIPTALSTAQRLGNSAYGAVSTPFTAAYGARTGDWRPWQSSADAVFSPLTEPLGIHSGDPLAQNAAENTAEYGRQMAVDSANPGNPWYQRYGGQVLGRAIQATPTVVGLAAGGSKALASAVGRGAAAPAAAAVAATAPRSLGRQALSWATKTPARAMVSGAGATGLLQAGANDVGLGKLQQQAIRSLEETRDHPETASWLRSLASGTANTLENPQYPIWNFAEPGMEAATDYVVAPAIDWAQGRKGVPLPTQQLRQQQQARTQAVSQATRELIQQEFEQAGKPATPEMIEQELQARWANQKSQEAQARWGVDFNAPPGMPQAPPVKSPVAQAATPAVQPAATPTEIAQTEPLQQLLQGGLEQQELNDLMQNEPLRQTLLLRADPQTKQRYIQNIDQLLSSQGQPTLSAKLQEATAALANPLKAWAVPRVVKAELQKIFPGAQLSDDEIQALLQAGQ